MIYVMSDIHGNKEAFQSVLDQISLKNDDTLYILGDIIDRHEHGVEILMQLMKQDNVKCLLGNHELMCLNAVIPHSMSLPWMRNDPYTDLHLWLRNGGGPTLRSFQKLQKEQYEETIQYLLKLPAQYEINVNRQKYILVHASPKELYSLEENNGYFDETTFCVWHRISDRSKLPADSRTVFGHTPTSEFQDGRLLRIWHTPNAIDIDCGSGFDTAGVPLQGRLACLRLDDMNEYYSQI